MNQALPSNEWTGGYSQRFSDEWSGGLTLRITDGQILEESPAPSLTGEPLRIRTDFTSPDVAVGIATKLSDSVTVGLIGTFGWVQTRNALENVKTLMVPTFPPNDFLVVPPNTVLDRFRDTVRTFVLGGGVGVTPTPALGFYGDARAVYVSSHRNGSVMVGRCLLGAEYLPIQALSLRAGVGVDILSQVNFSAGFGYKFSNAIEAQVAYQSNAAPEINREAGRARLFAASLTFRF